MRGGCTGGGFYSEHSNSAASCSAQPAACRSAGTPAAQPCWCQPYVQPKWCQRYAFIPSCRDSRCCCGYRAKGPTMGSGAKTVRCVLPELRTSRRMPSCQLHAATRDTVRGSGARDPHRSNAPPAGPQGRGASIHGAGLPRRTNGGTGSSGASATAYAVLARARDTATSIAALEDKA